MHIGLRMWLTDMLGCYNRALILQVDVRRLLTILLNLPSDRTRPMEPAAWRGA